MIGRSWGLKWDRGCAAGRSRRRMRRVGPAKKIAATYIVTACEGFTAGKCTLRHLSGIGASGEGGSTVCLDFLN